MPFSYEFEQISVDLKLSIWVNRWILQRKTLMLKTPSLDGSIGEFGAKDTNIVPSQILIF